jgi:hypothetical protein
MIAAQTLAVLLAAGLLAAVASGCESSQERSAQLEREGGKLIASSKGLVLHGTNADVTVLRTGVVQDANGIAVAVVLRNKAPRPAVAVPVAIDVRDAHGASIFKNDTPGLEPALTSIAYIAPHAQATWVNDQIVASGSAAGVRARVGATAPNPAASEPGLALGRASVVDDPVSGPEIVGFVTNRSSHDETKVIVSGVAWRGTKLVAAGRAVIQRLPAGKRAKFHILPIGNPQGAAISVAATETAVK